VIIAASLVTNPNTHRHKHTHTDPSISIGILNTKLIFCCGVEKCLEILLTNDMSVNITNKWIWGKSTECHTLLLAVSTQMYYQLRRTTHLELSKYLKRLFFKRKMVL